MNNTLSTAINHALALKHYRPSAKVNRTMSKLVKSVTIATEKELAQTSEIRQIAIRQVSSASEYELEVYWAQRVIHARKPNSELAKFPYTRNYALLVQRELELLASTGLTLAAHHTILIVGSGPLPLTYVELFKQSGASVDVLDSSNEAINISVLFCDALGLPTTHIAATGQAVLLTQQYDAILLAALAGDTIKDKQGIVDNLVQYLKHDGRLIARSSNGARTLLYPAIESPFDGLRLIAENHPDDEVINSILIYKKSHEK